MNIRGRAERGRHQGHKRKMDVETGSGMVRSPGGVASGCPGRRAKGMHEVAGFARNSRWGTRDAMTKRRRGRTGDG